MVSGRRVLDIRDSGRGEVMGEKYIEIKVRGVGVGVGTHKCQFFIHFIFFYSSHFIIPLTFYHTISIHICGFHLIISTLFIFSIISEFMIKY